jgi:methionine sulfoxide reductase heme-binding subunit
VKPGQGPLTELWWLVSRASGILALVLISVSVLMGLAMAAKVLRAPRAKRLVVTLHEHVALTALLAIGLHGAALLGDHWLKPGLTGITVPFALNYRPQFTGVGMIGGYLALLLGPSFYLRRRIGARRWRRLHTLIALSWLLSVIHTLGSGSDAHRLWLRALVALPVVPMAYLLTLRVLRPAPAAVRNASPRSASAQPPPIDLAHARQARAHDEARPPRRPEALAAVAQDG